MRGGPWPSKRRPAHGSPGPWRNSARAWTAALPPRRRLVLRDRPAEPAAPAPAARAVRRGAGRRRHGGRRRPAADHPARARPATRCAWCWTRRRGSTAAPACCATPQAPTLWLCDARHARRGAGRALDLRRAPRCWRSTALLDDADPARGHRPGARAGRAGGARPAAGVRRRRWRHRVALPGRRGAGPAAPRRRAGADRRRPARPAGAGAGAHGRLPAATGAHAGAGRGHALGPGPARVASAAAVDGLSRAAAPAGRGGPRAVCCAVPAPAAAAARPAAPGAEAGSCSQAAAAMPSISARCSASGCGPSSRPSSHQSLRALCTR